MTEISYSGPEQRPPAAPDSWSREFDQVQATVQALQGAASLLQGAMEQRQGLRSEMQSAEQSLAVLQQLGSQAQQALAQATSQLHRATGDIEQVRAEQTGLLAEFDKLVQGALARRTALVAEIADLERQRDKLTRYPASAFPPPPTASPWAPTAPPEPEDPTHPSDPPDSGEPVEHPDRGEPVEPVKPNAAALETSERPVYGWQPELVADPPVVHGAAVVSWSETPVIASLLMAPAPPEYVWAPEGAAPRGNTWQPEMSVPLGNAWLPAHPNAPEEASAPIIANKPMDIASAPVIANAMFGATSPAAIELAPVNPKSLAEFARGAPAMAAERHVFATQAVAPPQSPSRFAREHEARFEREPENRLRWPSLHVVATSLIVVMLIGLEILLTPVTQLLGGMQLLAVMSGSMEPTIEVGGIVAVRPVAVTALQVGDVITFANQSNPDVLITHRVVSLEARAGQTLVTTKGDANDSVDAVTVPATRSLGRVDFTLPWLGFVMLWLASPLAKVGILAISVIGFALPSGKRKVDPAADEPAPARTPGTGVQTPVPAAPAARQSPSYAAFEREIEGLLPRAS